MGFESYRVGFVSGMMGGPEAEWADGCSLMHADDAQEGGMSEWRGRHRARGWRGAVSRQEYPIAQMSGVGFGEGCGGGCNHQEVSWSCGTRQKLSIRWAILSGGITSARTTRPSLQTGQRCDSGPGPLESALDTTAVPGLVTGDAAFSRERHSASFSLWARLARKPNWRMRTKPRGKTCRRKRRMNSTASSVIVLFLFWSA